MKSITGVFIVMLGVILTALIAANAIKHRNEAQDAITVTGLGEKEFVSDLIVWEGNLIQESPSLQEAYRLIEQDKNQVREYMRSKNIPDSSVVFMFINIFKMEDPQYDDGRYVGTRFSGYRLSQTFKIESHDVEKVENVSREISELISKGIQIESNAPQYYYTKLSDLKLELIASATEDGRRRAQKVAGESKSKLGKLRSGRMGVFQITGANENEAYSWGGSFNTSSKRKKASITVKLEYHIKR